MLNLFSKIRRRLQPEGKTGKYLKYAVGEILLIVIGILIAIQLNTWRENSQQANLKQFYYGQILSDLEKDRAYVDSLKIRFNNNAEIYAAYLESYEEPGLNIQQVIQHLMELDPTGSYVNFHSSTLASLENSGELKLFHPDLRNTFTDLKRSLDYITYTHNDNVRLYLDTLVDDFLTNIGSYDLPDRLSNQPELASMVDLENNYREIFLHLEAGIMLKIAIEQRTLVRLHSVRKELDTLIDILPVELNK